MSLRELHLIDKLKAHIEKEELGEQALKLLLYIIEDMEIDEVMEALELVECANCGEIMDLHAGEGYEVITRHGSRLMCHMCVDRNCWCSNCLKFAEPDALRDGLCINCWDMNGRMNIRYE